MSQGLEVGRPRERGSGGDADRVVRLAGLVGGLVGGIVYGVWIILQERPGPGLGAIVVLLLGLGGAIFGFLGLPYVTIRPFVWFETKLKVTPLPDLLGATAGLAVGLGLAALIAYFLQRLPLGLGYAASLVLALALSYFGVTIGLSRGGEFGTLVRPASRSGPRGKRRGHPVLLDTSVIIDGRIGEVMRSGFVESTLLVPQFVLQELQYVADSPDAVRRSRGQRGLETLASLQTDPNVALEVISDDVPQVREVDTKLVRLAQRTGAWVMTLDHNLNRVAQLEGVRVLNLNDLALALRPPVIAGQEVEVRITKEGKEPGQGVAYLDDGTMVVVEGGRRFVGANIRAQVTSVLQTASGRIVFTQLAHPEGGG
ncbi:MAG: PIN domain-containing protein [Candidatus Dormibacteria bacterium]